METSVFISLIISVVIGVVIPVVTFVVMLIMNKIKLLQVMKGILASIVVNSIFLSAILTSIMQGLRVTSLVGFRMFIALTIYSFISLGMQFIIFKKVMRIEEEPENKEYIALGYGGCYAFTLALTAFQNLVIGDHIRVGDISYLSTMGIRDTQGVVSLFVPDKIGYFLSIGFQTLLVVGIQLALVHFFYQYIMNKRNRYLTASYILILVSNILLYMSVYLSSILLLGVTMTALLIVTYLCYGIKKSQLNLSTR